MKTIKVICINTGVFGKDRIINTPTSTYTGQSFAGATSHLELHKTYDGFYDNDPDPLLCGWYIDTGNPLMEWFPEDCFIELSIWRDQQINSILDE